MSKEGLFHLKSLYSVVFMLFLLYWGKNNWAGLIGNATKKFSGGVGDQILTH